MSKNSPKELTQKTPSQTPTQIKNLKSSISDGQEILAQLKKAKNAETRVKTFAKIVDTYGLDPILSLIPALGDGTSSTIAGLYLIFEAKQAGLDTTDYLKIISLQGADFFVGAIPILGDVTDIFFTSNKWSYPLFQERVETLTKQAQAAGVPESKIQKITENAKNLPQLIDKATST